MTKVYILFGVLLFSHIAWSFGVVKSQFPIESKLKPKNNCFIQSQSSTSPQLTLLTAKAIMSEDPEKKILGLSPKLFDQLQTSSFFVLWYLISAYYNIYNKRALNYVYLPWLIATIQMGTGLLLFFPMWFLKIRPTPFADISEFLTIISELRNVAAYTTLSHIAGVIALGTGAVSFTQVVKAAEPVFTALIAAVFTRQVWYSRTVVIYLLLYLPTSTILLLVVVVVVIIIIVVLFLLLLPFFSSSLLHFNSSICTSLSLTS